MKQSIALLLTTYFIFATQAGYSNGEKTILQGPENITVAEGANTQLLCVFSDNVDCAWYKSNLAVEISDRYSYIDGNGINTTSCTIVISSIGTGDVGDWYCGNKGGSNESPIKSKSAWLTLQPAFDNNVFKDDLLGAKAISQGPDNVTTLAGQDVQLVCIFTENVNCSWHKGDFNVEINDRYTYTNGRGINTIDCTIAISDVNAEYDSGIWYCSSQGSSVESPVKSNSAWLTVVTATVTPSVAQVTTIPPGNGHAERIDPRISALILFVVVIKFIN